MKTACSFRFRPLAFVCLFAISVMSAEATMKDPSFHVVRKGDTLSAIARGHGCTVQALMEVNNLTSSLIRLGQTLELPPLTGGPGAPPKRNSTTRLTVNKRQGPAFIHAKVLEDAAEKPVSVVIDLGRQRAFLLVGGRVAIDTPVSTGKKGHRTPSGTYRITEKIAQGKISNKYAAPMPYWMRLGTSPIGMHIGHLPGAPASHGCIRLPSSVAPLLFKHAKPGTPVQVVPRWNGPQEPLLADNESPSERLR